MNDVAYESGEREGVGLASADPETIRERLHAISYVLDNAIRIPGTNYRVGLDPLLGLLPVVGDVPASVLSAYIVAEAAALGVPRETLLRMCFNLVADAVLGSIPVVGDVFDATWKSNARNVALLEARRDDPDAAAMDRRYLLVVTAGLLVAMLALGIASAMAVLWILAQFGIGF